MADKTVSYTQKAITGPLIWSLSFTRNGPNLEWQAAYEQKDSNGVVRGHGSASGTTTVFAAFTPAFASSVLAECNAKEGT